MSVFTLKANTNYGAQYTVPVNGVVRYEVESEHPVVVVMMDAPNFAAFRAGQKYSSWGSGTPLQVHKQQQWTLPFRGPWYLVIINYNPYPTAVYFKAWS